jgi:hypothetical protein
MEKEKILSFVSKIYGILITLCLLGLFGPKLIGSIDKINISSIFNWYDNPTGFIFTYILGYIVIWWKPLWGSLIIIAGVLLFFIFNSHNVMFTEMFLLPTVLVSVLYLWSWYHTHKKQINTNV